MLTLLKDPRIGKLLGLTTVYIRIQRSAMIVEHISSLTRAHEVRSASSTISVDLRSMHEIGFSR